MNERIRELANCNERIQNFFETGPVQRAAIEQFAELIVRECAKACEKNSYLALNGWQRANQIKEHFGVKE